LVPQFPELRPFLEAAQQLAPKGAKWVIPLFDGSAAQGAAVSSEESHLEEVIMRWEYLPDIVRDVILSIVRSTPERG
jgi:hypothetical protein